MLVTLTRVGNGVAGVGSGAGVEEKRFSHAVKPRARVTEIEAHEAGKIREDV